MSTAYEHKTQLVGDDYLGLPTRPVRYRGARKGSTVDWDQIEQDYIARGGQVDASVWPNHGKVVVIGGSANSSRANIHTFTEATGDDYDNPLAQPAPQQRRTVRKLSDDQCRAIALRYRNDQASIRELADEYSVSTSAIHTALRFAGEPTRSVVEANRLRTRSAS